MTSRACLKCTWSALLIFSRSYFLPLADARVLTVESSTFNMKEDGMISVDYSDPEYFYQPIPVKELPLFRLPTPVDSDGPSDAVLVVSTLPRKAHLYYPNGTEITSVPAVTDGSFKFRPDLNLYGLYVFQYYARSSVDGVESKRTYAKISVESVPDPPRAFAFSKEVYHQSRAKLCLSGEDPDQNDNPTRVILVSKPSNGTLFRIADVAALKAGDSFGEREFCAYFKFSGHARFNGIDNYIGSDRFTFKLEDSQQLQSSEQSAVLRVRMPFQSGGSAPAVHSTVEDTNEIITLHAEDFSDSGFDLCFTISAPPLHGELFDIKTFKALGSGSTLSTCQYAGDTSGVQLIYRPFENYFNNPSKDFYVNALKGPKDQFSFFVSSADDPGYRAADATETIVVDNVNDPLIPVCPENVFGVRRAASLATDNDFGIHSNDRIYLSGIELPDLDQQSGAIRVVVNSTYGYLTVVPGRMETVKKGWFVCAEYWWGCQSTGLNDKVVSLVGTPENLQRAIDGIRYQSLAANVVDEVVLYVFDGKNFDLDESCIQNIGKQSSDECFIYYCVVEVEVRDTVEAPPPTALRLHAETSAPPPTALRLHAETSAPPPTALRLHAETSAPPPTALRLHAETSAPPPTALRLHAETSAPPPTALRLHAETSTQLKSSSATSTEGSASMEVAIDPAGMIELSRAYDEERWRTAHPTSASGQDTAASLQLTEREVPMRREYRRAPDDDVEQLSSGMASSLKKNQDFRSILTIVGLAVLVVASLVSMYFRGYLQQALRRTGDSRSGDESEHSMHLNGAADSSAMPRPNGLSPRAALSAN